MSHFKGPSGGIVPGLRRPFDRAGSGGHPTGYLPGAGFSPADLDRCYPMPAWVAGRMRDFPQAPEGNALRDPLPVPFTGSEVRNALLDVWRASHQRSNLRCATVSAASVQIALQVLPILRSRNGGWIDFSGRRYNPMVATPGSNRGSGVNLACLVFGLAGKPLPPVYGCNAAPPHPSRTYSINDVATTFELSDIVDAGRFSGFTPWAGAPFPGQPGRPVIGIDLEADGGMPAEPPGLPLFGLVASFEAHG